MAATSLDTIVATASEVERTKDTTKGNADLTKEVVDGTKNISVIET